MMKFTARVGDRIVVGFGIEKRNVDMLKEGKPLYVKFNELQLPAAIDPRTIELVIFYGDTLEDLKAQMKDAIGPHTVVVDTSDAPRKKGG